MADLATLQARLVDAEAAYHALMMGDSLVRIHHNQREMTYGQADAPRLAAYIADLNGQIARLEAGAPVSGRRGRSRPIIF